MSFKSFLPCLRAARRSYSLYRKINARIDIHCLTACQEWYVTLSHGDTLKGITCEVQSSSKDRETFPTTRSEGACISNETRCRQTARSASRPCVEQRRRRQQQQLPDAHASSREDSERPRSRPRPGKTREQRLCGAWPPEEHVSSSHHLNRLRDYNIPSPLWERVWLVQDALGETNLR